MLAIRMQRTGRSGHAQFRVVVQDSHFHPTRGRVVSYLGSYDPHTKTTTLDKEKVSQYLSNGAQPSDRVISLLKKEGVKLPDWVKASAPKTGGVRNADKRRSTRPADAEPTEAPASAEPAEPAEPETAEPAPEVIEAPAPETLAEPETTPEVAAEAETPAETPTEPEADLSSEVSAKEETPTEAEEAPEPPAQV